MKTKLVALAIVAVFSVFGVAFAQENTNAATKPTINLGANVNDVVATQPADELPGSAETTVEPTVETTTPEIFEENQTPTYVISDEAMTAEDMSNLIFFDTEEENVLAFAASSKNIVIKSIVGTVIYVSGNELHVNVPELNNDFCFECVEPYTQQLGESVTIWVVLTQN